MLAEGRFIPAASACGNFSAGIATLPAERRSARKARSATWEGDMAGEPAIDFFLFYSSTYTYLAVERVERLASAAGVAVRWRPFDLRRIMTEMNNIPFRGKPVKTRYMWRDLERRAALHGVPFARPPVYPADPDLLATRVGLVAAEQGWCPEYSRATYGAWFLEDRGPGMGENTAAVVASLGRDPEEAIAAAGSERIGRRLAEETDAARSLGVFGSPTFAVGGEIFWGDDRLEEALDWAVGRHPMRRGERPR
jgi:2-hydroxychromene-2-carboxylate isomerase